MKPNHTDQYLQFESHHPLIPKLGVIRTLFYRANTIISDPVQIDKEKEHITSALHKCGYPNWAFHKAAKTHEDTQKGAPKPLGRPGRRPARITIWPF